MSAAKKKARKGSVAFPALVLDEDSKRNTRMAAADPRTPPELRAELQRYLDDPLKAATADMQQLLDERARARVGRPGGADREITELARQHIRTLLAAHPDLIAKPAKLWAHADKSIVGHLNGKRWINLVGEVRKDR